MFSLIRYLVSWDRQDFQVPILTLVWDEHDQLFVNHQNNSCFQDCRLQNSFAWIKDFSLFGWSKLDLNWNFSSMKFKILLFPLSYLSGFENISFNSSPWNIMNSKYWNLNFCASKCIWFPLPLKQIYLFDLITECMWL